MTGDSILKHNDDRQSFVVEDNTRPTRRQGVAHEEKAFIVGQSVDFWATSFGHSNGLCRLSSTETKTLSNRLCTWTIWCRYGSKHQKEGLDAVTGQGDLQTKHPLNIQNTWQNPRHVNLRPTGCNLSIKMKISVEIKYSRPTWLGSREEGRERDRERETQEHEQKDDERWDANLCVSSCSWVRVYPLGPASLLRLLTPSTEVTGCGIGWKALLWWISRSSWWIECSRTWLCATFCWLSGTWRQCNVTESKACCNVT